MPRIKCVISIIKSGLLPRTAGKDTKLSATPKGIEDKNLCNLCNKKQPAPPTPNLGVVGVGSVG